MCYSQLVDHPEQAVPARGALVLQLVVVEGQQHADSLPAAHDGGHVLQGRGRPGEPRHWGGGRGAREKGGGEGEEGEGRGGGEEGGGRLQ